MGPLLRWLIHMTGGRSPHFCWLLTGGFNSFSYVGRRPQFFISLTSPLGFLSVLIIWQPTSSRASDLSEKRETAMMGRCQNHTRKCIDNLDWRLGRENYERETKQVKKLLLPTTLGEHTQIFTLLSSFTRSKSWLPLKPHLLGWSCVSLALSLSLSQTRWLISLEILK